MKHILVALAAAFGLMSAPALAAAPDASAPAPTYAIAKDGADIVLGKPSAPVTLDEYLSYTCPHCAHFAAEADGDIGAMLAAGSLKVRLVPALRDPLDASEAMLIRCVPPRAIPAMHQAFFTRQDELYNAARRTPAFYTDLQKLKASDVGQIVGVTPLAEMARKAGLDKAALARCTGDDAALTRLRGAALDAWKRIQAAAAARGEQGGTPSFAIDGKMQGTAEWPELKKTLETAAGHHG